MLLPSPRTSDTNGVGHHGDGGMDLRTAVSFLPTPSAADSIGGHERRGGARGDDLLLKGVVRAVTEGALLPTPVVGSSSPAAHGQISGQWREQMAKALAQWGEYEPVIRRWEALTRPAPEPTKTGAKGNPKLSDEFDEWLMGLPAGWITDVPGVTWNEALKACGNGVVPQQATAGLHYLRELSEWAA